MPTWSLWVGGIVLGLIVFFIQAWFYYRRTVRNDFVDYLRQTHPEIEILGVDRLQVRARSPKGHEGSLSLSRLYLEVSETGDDLEAKHKLFEALASVVLEGDRVSEVTPEDRSRLRPRIVTSAFLDGACEQAQSVAWGDLGVEGLATALVLDAEYSAAYVTQDMLAKLDLTFDDAMAMAKQNLEGLSDMTAVRQAVDEDALALVKTMDTYDAARLLLVPDVLASGEELVAVIPDRDTLGLAPRPRDDDWDGLAKLARKAAGDPLCRVPLLVSHDGVRILDADGESRRQAG